MHKTTQLPKIIQSSLHSPENIVIPLSEPRKFLVLQPVNLATFYKSNIKQFPAKSPTFTLLQLRSKQLKKYTKTKHHEQHLQRINSRLWRQQIRWWLLWHHHRFRDYLVAVGSMQLKHNSVIESLTI